MRGGGAAREGLRGAVTPMSAAIRHRGPNSEGRISTPCCEVGFRRLSIVDLEGGHQPLGNEEGTIEVFLNGEIYNHAELRAQLTARGPNRRQDRHAEQRHNHTQRQPMRRMPPIAHQHLNANKHKMVPIPVCEIPMEMKS